MDKNCPINKKLDELPSAVERPKPRLYFSHRLHQGSEEQCASCHSLRAESMTLPEMELCLQCHGPDGEQARDCGHCHLSGADGRLETHFDEGVLAPTGRFRQDDHRDDFVQRHADAARLDARYCESCHSPRECEDCHQGLLRPIALHPSGYLAEHAIDARADSQTCSSCHQLDRDCAGCHERSFVGESWTPPSDSAIHARDFTANPMSTAFHGVEARKNIGQCMSCHEQGSCVRCHAGIRPHPPGFERDCASLLRRNPATCEQCHGAQAARRLNDWCQ